MNTASATTQRACPKALAREEAGAPDEFDDGPTVEWTPSEEDLATLRRPIEVVDLSEGSSS